MYKPRDTVAQVKVVWFARPNKSVCRRNNADYYQATIRRYIDRWRTNTLSVAEHVQAIIRACAPSMAS